MLINNRLIWGDNGTLKDLSINVNNLFAPSEIVAFTAAEDFLYIGSDLPFNHRYFLLETDNDADSVVSAQIWDGSQWQEAVDVLDLSKDSGGTKSLGQSGVISWVIDRNKAWTRYASTELMTGSGLETLKIYNLYWVRLKFSNDLNALTAIKYLGHKFSGDADLGGYYPDLIRTNVMAGFSAGKTDWDDQHVLAAEEIVRDLRKKQVLWNANQIFGWDEFSDASIHKVAEIIYSAFGKNYEERRELAREKYDEALDKVVNVAIDKDEDGRLEQHDKRPAYGRLVRR